MAQVNGETGARDFIVRQAEIDQAKAAAQDSDDAAEPEATPAPRSKTGAKTSAKPSIGKTAAAKSATGKAAEAKAKTAGADVATEAAEAMPATGKPVAGKTTAAANPAGFSAVERAKAAFARSLTASAQIEPIGSRGAPVPAVAPVKLRPAIEASAPAAETAPAAAPAVGGDGLKALVARHAAANGVPFALADAIVKIESRYNPRASHAGNYGLMQIRHQTARGMGYGGAPGGLLDAETNARFGMKYLAMAYRLAGGDTCRTVMKYQGGHMSERMSGANRTYCAKVRTLSAHN